MGQDDMLTYPTFVSSVGCIAIPDVKVDSCDS